MSDAMEVEGSSSAAAVAETDTSNGSAKQPSTGANEGSKEVGDSTTSAAATEPREAPTEAAKDAVTISSEARVESGKGSEGQGAPDAEASVSAIGDESTASGDPKQKKTKPGGGSHKVQVRSAKTLQCWPLPAHSPLRALSISSLG